MPKLKKNIVTLITEAEKQKRDHWWLTQWILNIIPLELAPNWITASRLAFFAVSFTLWQIQGAVTIVQLLILGLAALTDYIDGSMARTRNQITAFGTIFDPIADDVLGVWIIILLIKNSMLNFWVGASIIAFETSLTLGAGIWILIGWLKLKKEERDHHKAIQRLKEAVLENLQVNIISRVRFGTMLAGLAMLMLASSQDKKTLFDFFNYSYLSLILIGISLLILGFIDNKNRLLNIGKFITGAAIIITTLHLIEPFIVPAGQWIIYFSLLAFIPEIIGYLKNIRDEQKNA